jgi:hypothetical protein
MGAALEQHDQLVRGFDRELPQQHLIDQGEDGGVGAYAERQRQDSDGCKQRIAAKSAGGKAQVCPGCRHGALDGSNPRPVASTVHFSVRLAP